MKLIGKLGMAAVLFALGLAAAVPANASIVISGTRVVYNQQDSEVTLKLTNAGQSPALAQIWMDKGDTKAAPESIDLPFTITPPLVRLDPNKAQTLRIVYTGEPLPTDKESVFYLNMLEIPPKATGPDAPANSLQFAFRTRIKFFYRPNGLKGSAADAPGQLVWRVKQDGKTAKAVVTNPSLYHVSLDSFHISNNGQKASFTEGGMINPGETKEFPLTGGAVGAGSKVHYVAINDYGGPQEGDAAVAP